MIKSLQSKIFFFFVLLLLIVQTVAILTINKAIQDQVKQQVNNQRLSSNAIIQNHFSLRNDHLIAFAETVAKDYALKQFFEEDVRTFLGAINNHRKRMDADIAFSIDADSMIKTQLIRTLTDNGKDKLSKGSEVGQNFRYQSLLLPERSYTLYLVDGNMYQLSIAPLKSGAKVIGWIGFGFRIDSRLASRFASDTGFNIEFIVQQGERITSLAASKKDGIAKDLVRAVSSGKVPDSVVGNFVLLGKVENNVLGVVMVKSKADLLIAIKKRWLQLVALVGFTLLVCLSGAYFIAKGITRPVKELAKQAKLISGGDYKQVVAIDDPGELGQLASEFKAMQTAVLTREEEIMHRVYHDSLTDLPNRNALIRRLTESTETERIGLYVLNLRHTKDVNDTMGHDVGDLIIKECGSRLFSVSSFYFVAHIGADEFVLVENNFSMQSVGNTISTLEKLLIDPVSVDCVNLYLQVRVGVACYPEHGDKEHLLQKADTALHIARKKHHLYMLYDASLDQNTLERLNLISDLKVAIEENQLILFYQPKVCLKTRKATHVEALVRWMHPNLGMIPPDSFISIAEQTGQIDALTKWVLAEAMRQYKVWRKKNIELCIAVNVSAQNLKDDQFYDYFCQLVADTNTPLKAITLEVTESAVVEEPEQAIELLQRFKDAGVHLSIDDYGTGYSSLAQLKQLPVHELKIDKSFVQKLPEDSDDSIIVQSTIELSHNMGLSVVAEGVETAEAMAWLTERKCELAQGYFISRPVPGSELETWLINSEYYEPQQAAV